MRAPCWLVLLGLAGCLEPQLQPCGDQLCAIDAVCLASGQCASAESIAACTDLAPDATCSTPLFTGSCIDGACIAPRCGDGVVSGSEQCDGSVPGIDCADYGFDLGLPACSAVCTLDVVNTCISFGWERALSAPSFRLWTDGTHTAVVSEDRTAIQVYTGDQLVLEHTHPSPRFRDVTGNGTSYAVSSDDGILFSDRGAPFALLPAYSDKLAMSPDGVLYYAESADLTCRISRRALDGTLSEIKPPSTACQMLRWSGDHLYVSYFDGVLERWDTSSWSSVVTGPGVVRDVAELDGTAYATTGAGGAAYRLVGGTVSLIPGVSGEQVVAIPSAIYFGGEDTEVGLALRGSSESFRAPINGRLATDGTSLFIYGSSLYRYTEQQFTLREGTSQVTDLVLLGDGMPAMAAYGELAWPYADIFWRYRQPVTGDAKSIAGPSIDNTYVLGPNALERFDGNAFSDVTVPADVVGMNDLAWAPSTTTLYLVGDDRAALAYQGATWTTLTPPSGTASDCSLARVEVGTSTVYAAGRCGTQGIVWQLAGTAWTEIHRGSIPLASLAIDSADNLYAVGPSGWVQRVSGTWREDPAHTGTSISATSPDAIWIGGGPKELEHWNGTSWSRVALLGASRPHVLATPDAVYIGGASTSVLLQ